VQLPFKQPRRGQDAVLRAVFPYVNPLRVNGSAHHLHTLLDLIAEIRDIGVKQHRRRLVYGLQKASAPLDLLGHADGFAQIPQICRVIRALHVVNADDRHLDRQRVAVGLCVHEIQGISAVFARKSHFGRRVHFLGRERPVRLI
jgi:hypothetical protein